MSYLALLTCTFSAILVLELLTFTPTRLWAWVQPPLWVVLLPIALFVAWCIGDD